MMAEIVDVEGQVHTPVREANLLVPCVTKLQSGTGGEDSVWARV